MANGVVYIGGIGSRSFDFNGISRKVGSNGYVMLLDAIRFSVYLVLFMLN